MIANNAEIKKWEQAEIERSRFEASLQEDLDLHVGRETLDRYYNPPQDTSYALEYSYHLLGDARAKRVLDLGCGKGENTIQLVNRGAQVTGVDISDSLIEIAKRRMRVNGFTEGFDFKACSAHEMPFANESFDIVFGMAVLHHLDLELASREVWRVLRPGGYAIFQEPVRNSKVLSFIRGLIPYRAPDVSPFERPLTDLELAQFARRFSQYQSKAFHSIYVNMAWMIPGVCNLAHPILRFDSKLVNRSKWLQHHATVRVVKMVK
jgi:ubiquinone/menaquinone biosynthesis C-methylase UbiE